MSEMEDVVVPIAIRIDDIVGQTITKIDSVASKDHYLLFAARALQEFHLEPSRQLFFLGELAVKKPRIDSLTRPSILDLLNVARGGGLERHLRLASDGEKQVPDAKQE